MTNDISGLQGGVVQSKLDGTGLQWASQYNQFLSTGDLGIAGFDNSRPGESLDNTAVFYPVFNFGIIYSTYDNENIYIRDRSLMLGLSVDNLNRPLIGNPEFGNSRKEMLVRGFGSAKLEIAPRWFVHPSVYALYSRGSEQYNVGTYFSSLVSSVRSNNAVLIQMGLWYRIDDSIIILTGMQLDNLRLGVSVDWNTNSIDPFDRSGNRLSTYEISLTYNLDFANPLRHIPSPIL